MSLYILKKMANSFNQFIYEQGIIGMTMGTIAGFAVSNLMTDIKKEFLVHYIKKNKFLKQFYLLPSLIEFMIMFLILFFIYQFILKPLFYGEMKRDKLETKREKKWKHDVLREIKNLDMGTVYLS